MTNSYLLLALLSLGALAVLLYPGWRKRRLLAQPFPAPWLEIISRRQPLYASLAAGEQKQLRDLVLLFLAEKHFHGCAGQQIDDEIRVTIAAQACLLLLNRKTALFPRLRHILVYPSAFVMQGEQWNEDGTVSEVSEERLGESWQHGKVILSWEDVDHDSRHPDDGNNVVLHEFAHQLDSESGVEDGMPPLRYNDPDSWREVMEHEYAALCRLVESAGEEDEIESVLDPYGAESPVEFFAVATEAFFEVPVLLDEWHPRLFRQLRDFYRVDPRAWQA